MKKVYYILILIILIVVLLFAFNHKKEYYCSFNNLEEFNQLNKCYSDEDCVLGQEDVGTDLTSPSPECVSKEIIKNCDYWFESQNKGYFFCFCNLTENKCLTGKSS